MNIEESVLSVIWIPVAEMWEKLTMCFRFVVQNHKKKKRNVSYGHWFIVEATLGYFVSFEHSHMFESLVICLDCILLFIANFRNICKSAWEEDAL